MSYEKAFDDAIYQQRNIDYAKEIFLLAATKQGRSGSLGYEISDNKSIPLFLPFDSNPHYIDGRPHMYCAEIGRAEFTPGKVDEYLSFAFVEGTSGNMNFHSGRRGKPYILSYKQFEEVLSAITDNYITIVLNKGKVHKGNEWFRKFYRETDRGLIPIGNIFNR